MNMNRAKKLFLVLLTGIYFLSSSPVQASPWAEKEGGYWSKTGGKFAFALNNCIFGWLSPWTEAKNPKYKKEWEGFSAGIGQAVVYTAGGLIQLVTFPIPIDFPNIKGLHIPQQNCPKSPYGVDKSKIKEVPAEPAVEAAPAPEPVKSAVPKPVIKKIAPPAPVPAPAVEPVKPKTFKRTIKKSIPKEKKAEKSPESVNSEQSELIK